MILGKHTDPGYLERAPSDKSGGIHHRGGEGAKRSYTASIIYNTIEVGPKPGFILTHIEEYLVKR